MDECSPSPSDRLVLQRPPCRRLFQQAPGREQQVNGTGIASTPSRRSNGQLWIYRSRQASLTGSCRLRARCIRPLLRHLPVSGPSPKGPDRSSVKIERGDLLESPRDVERGGRRLAEHQRANLELSGASHGPVSRPRHPAVVSRRLRRNIITRPPLAKPCFVRRLGASAAANRSSRFEPSHDSKGGRCLASSAHSSWKTRQRREK